MWGTMYVPYRKGLSERYESALVVTAFTVGELLTMFFADMDAGWWVALVGVSTGAWSSVSLWLFWTISKSPHTIRQRPERN